ncbi:hypothetical protein [Ornithinimicrobium murale]|uniref:hypothetical protein n=1 Tax=Ornithinimicrobium murale TaxID=1050153 RepID=UPI00307BFBB0
MMDSIVQGLQDFTASLPEWLQWAGIVIAGAIPFVESYLGSVIGVLAGLPLPIAIAMAVIGNLVTMLLVVLGAGAVRSRVARDKPESARRRKLRERFDRFGVAGVSLLGQTILPSQITSAAMVSFGASRHAVIAWQTVSIILWGVAFGLLAHYGVTMID